MFGDWHRSELDLESDCCELSLHLCSQARFWLLKKVPEELLGSATAAICPNLSFLQRSRWIFYPAKEQVNEYIILQRSRCIYYSAKKQVNILFCKGTGEYIVLQRWTGGHMKRTTSFFRSWASFTITSSITSFLQTIEDEINCLLNLDFYIFGKVT